VADGRCEMDGRRVLDSATQMCLKHVNELLRRYKPTKCAACPQPLSSGGMPCPEWLREQLGAHHGAFVHMRPCYEKTLAAKKQQAADTQPMEVEQENISPSQTSPLTSVSHASTQIRLRLCTHAHTWSLSAWVLLSRAGHSSFPVGHCGALGECSFHHLPTAAASRRCCSRLPPLRLQASSFESCVEAVRSHCTVAIRPVCPPRQ